MFFLSALCSPNNDSFDVIHELNLALCENSSLLFVNVQILSILRNTCSFRATLYLQELAKL